MAESLASLLFDPHRPYIHRDLSWLQFNMRVLNEARDASNPLLERLRFLGITASNLDEFFMIRFASIEREISALEKKVGGEAQELARLKSIRAKVLRTISLFVRKEIHVFDALTAQLREHRIIYLRDFETDPKHFEFAKQTFDQRILSRLKARSELHPDFLKQLENLQVAMIFPDRTVSVVPRDIPPILWQRGGSSVLFVSASALLQKFAGPALGSQAEPLLIRVTRDGDIDLYRGNEDPETIPDIVRQRVRSRETGKPVRVQLVGNEEALPLEELVHWLRLTPEQVFKARHPLGLRGLFTFTQELAESGFGKKVLYFPPLKSLVPSTLAGTTDIFHHLTEQNYLLHHPYDSFDCYENFLEAATNDPAVESIQQTFYRVDALSRVPALLKKAAKHKEVRVFIEPRARFDEINNIRLAEELRQEGVKVFFASGKLKLHAKIALICRREGDRIAAYTHLSTGNYNAKTAQIYTDLAIITAHPGLGKDAQIFFDALAEQRVPESLEHLVLAPLGLHRRMRALINAETNAALNGAPARIFAKVNALVDEKIIDDLYAASKAGVKIDLLVRGACSLVPGVEGLSENIRVISIVDRFLEHSRIYYFASSQRMFLSSADWMPRNFFSRLEIAFPVLDPRIFRYISECAIPIYLGDRVKARRLTEDGSWRMADDPREGKRYKTAQQQFADLAAKGYRNTPLVP